MSPNIKQTIQQKIEQLQTIKKKTNIILIQSVTAVFFSSFFLAGITDATNFWGKETQAACQPTGTKNTTIQGPLSSEVSINSEILENQTNVSTSAALCHKHNTGIIREVKPEIQENTKPILSEDAKQQMASRINRFSLEIGSPLSDQYGMVWVETGIKYNRHPYALVAIAMADTTLGKYLSTPYNLGNVGNTDTCPKCRAFKSWEQGIEAIAQTLTNQYLKNATKLCHLSRGGWNVCPEGKKINGGYFYASSLENWNRNSIWAECWLHGTELTHEHSIILSDYYIT